MGIVQALNDTVRQ